MVSVNFFNLYYYISQSLLGYITEKIRAISFAYNKDQKLILYVYLSVPQDNEDTSNMFSAMSEAESMFDTRIDYDVAFVVTNDKLTDLNKFDGWLFMRYEKELY